MQPENAVIKMIELIKQNPNEIEVLCIGPLTNLAMAICLEPKIPQMLKNLFVMGGTDSARGNESQTAEFNFYADPEATEIVLERFKETEVKVNLVTWECTIKNAISWEFYDRLCDKSTTEGFLMKEISKAMEKFLRDEGSGLVSDYIIPDFVAAAVLIDESLV